MAKKAEKTNIGDLNYGTKEWQNAWDSLGPQDQQALMGLSYDPSASLPDEEPFDFGTQQYAMDPMYAQLVQSGGGVALPQLTAKGALEPYDLSQEAQRVNLMQDNATSMADLVMAALSGPGAIDPQTFAPVVTQPKERIATPGLDRVKQYSQGTGAKAYIARKIMAGATDDEAIADLFNFIDTPDSDTVSEADRKTKQMIIDSMPSAFKTGQVVPPSGRGTGGSARTTQDTRDLFNESSLATDAREMYEKAYEDQSKIDVGWEDPDKPGTYYTEAPTSEDSPAMQKFRNLGLPSPFAAYNDPDYLQMAYDTMAPNLGSDMAARDENIARTQAEQDRIAEETRGPIDRNIATQKLFRDTGGMQPATLPQAPKPGAQPGVRGGVQINPSTGGTVDAQGHGVFSLNPTGASMPSVDANGHAIMRDYKPGGPVAAPAAPTPPPMTMGGVRGSGPAPKSMVPIRGLVNPQGGFDFGGARPVEQQAMANALLNFVGGGKRGTKVTTLDAGTAKKSAKQADEARKKFSQANDRRYEASQYTSDDMGQAAYALGVANAMARAGNTPFIDVANQRKLGQRMMGVRA